MEKASTILLAEDNADDARLFRWAFEKTGLDSRCLQIVNNGAQAILYLKGESPYSDRAKFPFPSLVFLDLDMPIKSGLEVLVWVRQQPALQKLPVIVLTATSFDSIIRTAYALGASSFQSKPPLYTDFAAELKQLIDFWLSNQSASPVPTTSGEIPVSSASSPSAARAFTPEKKLAA